MRREYDYVIVGGGSAGCIVAARLAQKFPDASVAILEAGPSDETCNEILSLKNWPQLLNGPFDRIYPLEPQAHGNTFAHQDRHIGLGGCSSHNSCIAFIPPAQDFARWEALGANHWSPNNVMPFFERVLSTVRLETARSGNLFFDAALQAALQAGLPKAVFNSPEFLQSFAKGAAYFDCNKVGDLRHSSSIAYLHSKPKPNNLFVVTNCPVLHVMIDTNHRAIGVETLDGPIYAHAQIVLSTGALETPKILMLSGVGPHEHLKRHNIPTRIDLPGVGSHLLDHPESVISFKSKKPIDKESSQGWEVGVFERVGTEESNQAPPDLMLHVGNDGFFMQTARRGYPTSEHAFCFTPNVTKAKSEGTVRLRSAHALDKPRVDFNYLSHAHDVVVLREGIKIAREIASQAGLKDWVDCELAPGRNVVTDRDLEDYVRRTHNTVYHPAGTCAIGSVVDPQLRVLGVDNLRVADASVFIEHTTVNPNLTVYMIGERCAEFI